jgi:uncharacterized membrane protein YjgN (DUF898 family)
LSSTPYLSPAGAGWLANTDEQPSAGQPERFAFTGSGSEYFRIWIVNLMLNIATLGIYSAWAKVRKLRYFYNSTRVAGASFEYHGNPVAILKGRLIAVACLIGYNLAGKFSVTAGLIALAALMLVMPWLIWKSMQFKLFNSSYRGIRFGFRGSAGRAYAVYLLLPALAALSVYLLAPFAHQRMKKFQHEESRFGTTHFSFHASVGGFYKAYLICFLIAVAGIIVIGLGFYAALGAPGGWRKGGVLLGGIALFFLAIYAWLFSLVPLFLTMIQNLIWNHTRLGENRFSSSMKWGRMAFIAVTNMMGIVLTLGLFVPFAQIRAMRYRIESMALMPHDSLDNFIAATQQQASGTGEGMADLFDFDLSL